MARLASVKEWVGGVVEVPGYVTGEGEPFRPKMLVWIVPNGPILASEALPPDVHPVAACVDSFHATSKAPAKGRPHVPTHVRVASPEMAKALRAGLPKSVDVVCAPTPEVDELAESLRRFLNAQSKDEPPPTYLGPGIAPEAVASFFRAAARLHRAAPWSVVPDDSSVLEVAIDALGVKDGVVSVIGQAGQSCALILFPDIESFVGHLAMAELAAQGVMPKSISPHLALNFERGGELDPALRAEIARHAWEVAAPTGYPSPVAVDADIVGRPVTARELAILEVVSVALAEWIEGDASLRSAWSAARAATRTTSVTTREGPARVTLTVVTHAERDTFTPLLTAPSLRRRTKKTAKKAPRKRP